MSGAAWNDVYADAHQDTSTPNISDQDDRTDSYTFAKALVYVRTGDASYRSEVVSTIMAAIETENGVRTLALGRNLVGYVLAADLVGLDGAEDQTFRTWLAGVRSETLDGRTLISTPKVSKVPAPDDAKTGARLPPPSEQLAAATLRHGGRHV